MDQLSAQLDGHEFIIARSDFLDAFAGMEAAVHRIIASCGRPVSGAPLACQMKQFREAEKTSLIACANFSARDRIAKEIEELLPVRADIVHSQMRVTRLDKGAVALFLNAREAHEAAPQARMLSLKQFRTLIGRAVALRSEIEALNRPVSPASSPPQPSPGAAGDP